MILTRVEKGCNCEAKCSYGTRKSPLSRLSLCASCQSQTAMAATLKNVLMITSDDLRTQLNASYGTETITPNLDRLADEGTTFHRAYCQQAVCSPSRNSFMSGRRPDTTNVWNFIESSEISNLRRDFLQHALTVRIARSHFRLPDVGANWTSLPQYFKEQGFLTYASGKLFHPKHPPNNDFPLSWTEDEHNAYYWGNGLPIGDSCPCTNRWPPGKPCTAGSDNCPCPANVSVTLLEAWASPTVCQYVDDAAALDDADVKDMPQTQQLADYDHRVATRAIENMGRAVGLQRRFFVAAGFRKPHVDWLTPQRFYAPYAGRELALAKHQTIGDGVPLVAFEMNGPLNQVFVDAAGGTHRESAAGPPRDPTAHPTRRRAPLPRSSPSAHAPHPPPAQGRRCPRSCSAGCAGATTRRFHSSTSRWAGCSTRSTGSAWPRPQPCCSTRTMVRARTPAPRHAAPAPHRARARTRLEAGRARRLVQVRELGDRRAGAADHQSALVGRRGGRRGDQSLRGAGRPCASPDRNTGPAPGPRPAASRA